MNRQPLGRGYYINVSKNHTFGTDAVLLADFASAKKVKTHCDLGAGCGIISMLLVKNSVAGSSVGIEISEEAVELAKATANEFAKDKFTPINADIRDLKGTLPFGSFDLVTCNPPYKAEGSGLLSAGERDIVARHETMCTLEDVVSASSRLLKSSGRLCLCQRPERLSDIVCLLRQYKLEAKRIRTVHKKVGEEPWLVLVEGMRDAKSGTRILPPLFVYDKDGNLSEEMIKIYGDYKEGYL